MHSITAVLPHLSTLVSLTSVTCKILHRHHPRNRTALSSAPITNRQVSCKGSAKTKLLLGRGLRSMMSTGIGRLGKLNSAKVNRLIKQCIPLLRAPWFRTTK